MHCRRCFTNGRGIAGDVGDKIAGLVALEVECGAAPGILEALDFPRKRRRPSSHCSSLGHASEASLRFLVRPEQTSLDLSSAARPIVAQRREEEEEEEGGGGGGGAAAHHDDGDEEPLAACLPRLLLPCLPSLTCLDLTGASLSWTTSAFGPSWRRASRPPRGRTTPSTPGTPLER